jgi:hypothetical protein
VTSACVFITRDAGGGKSFYNYESRTNLWEVSSLHDNADDVACGILQNINKQLSFNLPHQRWNVFGGCVCVFKGAGMNF